MNSNKQNKMLLWYNADSILTWKGQINCENLSENHYQRAISFQVIDFKHCDEYKNVTLHSNK